MREGTRRLVADVEGIEVVGTASDYESVRREAKRFCQTSFCYPAAELDEESWLHPCVAVISRAT